VSHDSTQRPRSSPIFWLSKQGGSLETSTLNPRLKPCLCQSLPSRLAFCPGPAGPGLAGLHIECLILSLACRGASVKQSAQTRLMLSVPTDTAIIFLKMPLKPKKNRCTKCELPVSATLRYSTRTKGSTAVQRREPNIALNIGLVRRWWAESGIPQGSNLTSSRVSRPSTRNPIPWKPCRFA
jgi:hypothetical protein